MSDITRQATRREDRHSCHHLSFLLGLAVRARAREADQLWAAMLHFVAVGASPPDQMPN